MKKDSLFRFAITAELAWICGGTMAVHLLPAAWAARGFRGGIGGEWLLILLAAAVGGWIGWGIIRPTTPYKRKKARQHWYC